MISRRAFLAGTTAFLASPVVAAMPRFLESSAFDHDTVSEIARDLAARPYAPRPQVPAAWRDLTYDQYRTIWFRERDALWGDSNRPYRVDLFHPGLYFPQGVALDIVQGDTAQRLAFDIDLFDRTDKSPELPIDETMGYSGFRLRTELEKPGVFQEFCVFQGASYFRAHALGQVYGLSARGLALKTGDPEGEEFPDFTRFWLETPEPGARQMVVHALLDSPSVAGAFKFTIRPGETCGMEVTCTLFPRVDLDHVGIAPLTSMFLYDETNRTAFDDFRPAVHDSDGLLIWNGAGEMLWRPLSNPRGLGTSAFVDDSPRGFGLMQRADAYSDFADLEAHYHRRPSAWIEPGEDWGPGVVRLVEIPSDQEIYDNIVAYWRPREPLKAGRAATFSYRLTWGGDPARRRDVARVDNTHMGLNFNRDRRVVLIDYADHPDLRGDLSDVSIHVSSMLADTTDGILQRNPETGGARLAFSFDPGERQQVELRAQLLRGGTPVTEVWLYRWMAPA